MIFAILVPSHIELNKTAKSKTKQQNKSRKKEKTNNNNKNKQTVKRTQNCKLHKQTVRIYILVFASY